jgi:hypothetical protein
MNFEAIVAYRVHSIPAQRLFMGKDRERFAISNQNLTFANPIELISSRRPLFLTHGKS